MEAESRARCVRRWQALGLTRDEALALYNDATVGAPHPDVTPSLQNPIKFVQAAMGTGKSLVGERLHGMALDHLRRDMEAPLPIYLESRPSPNGLREAIIKSASALGDPTRQGATVVIDDQINHESASIFELLDDARYLAELWPQTTFAVLNRPLTDVSRIPEAVNLPNLSEEETQSLVSRLNGHIAYRLPYTLKEAIGRPLFAILLAIATRQNENIVPQSRGELLSDLVRHALGLKQGKQSPLQEILERLSIAVLSRGGPVPTIEIIDADELPNLIKSGLIVHQQGTIRFVLDIFLEWFAAQAMTKGLIIPEQLLADERLLERWFFALVMFVAESSHADVTTFLAPLTRQNPTMASQIIREALESSSNRALFEEDQTQPPTYDECGKRLRETMQAWADGLGPLKQLIAPVDNQGKVLPVGVVVGRSIFARSWYGGSEAKPSVVELPSELVAPGDFIQSFFSIGTGWKSCVWNGVGTAPGWAWNETRRELSSKLAEIIRAKGFPLEGELRGGPLWKEIIWVVALRVVGYGSLWMQPVSLDIIGKRLDEVPEANAVTLSSGRIFSLLPLREEVARLRVKGESELVPPYPGPDEYSPDGWLRDPITGKKTQPEFGTVGSPFYDNFSDEGLAAHVSAIYGAALCGYEQLVQTWLPSFASRLNTSVLLPVRLVGVVQHPWHNRAWGASIEWYFDPLPFNEQSRIEVHSWSPQENKFLYSEELMVSLIQRRSAMRPRVAHWLRTSISARAVSLGDTPAFDLAYEWLKDDLKQAGWLD